MTAQKLTNPQTGAPPQRGTFFGVPLGNLGFLPSLLMALTTALMTFFAVTFLAIVGIMIYNGLGHSVNYADSYRWISLPAGCVMLVVSLTFFGTLWLRRKLSGN